MATSAMPQPGSSPQPQQGGGDASSQGGASPQMSQVQEFFAGKAMEARKIGMQSVAVQPEMQQISQLWVQALQKISQAASGPPQQAQAPGVS